MVSCCLTFNNLMSMKNFVIIILFFTLIIFSCKTKEVVSPNEHEGSRLVLKHGGGFTGAYKTYYLLDNGQLFKKSSEFEKMASLKSLSQETVDQIFSNYEILGIGNEKLESYGNLNYEITMINKDGEEHKSIWEKGQKGAEKHQLYYRNIMNQIRLNNIDENEGADKKVVK